MFINQNFNLKKEVTNTEKYEIYQAKKAIHKKKTNRKAN